MKLINLLYARESDSIVDFFSPFYLLIIDVILNRPVPTLAFINFIHGACSQNRTEISCLQDNCNAFILSRRLMGCHGFAPLVNVTLLYALLIIRHNPVFLEGVKGIEPSLIASEATYLSLILGAGTMNKVNKRQSWNWSVGE